MLLSALDPHMTQGADLANGLAEPFNFDAKPLASHDDGVKWLILAGKRPLSASIQIYLPLQDLLLGFR